MTTSHKVTLWTIQHINFYRKLLKEKMIYAAWMMANQENQNQQRYKINARIYESLRQKYSRVKSAHTKTHNPMNDPEVRTRHQEAIDRHGKTSGNTGHKRGPISNELKEILRQKTIDSMTPERRESIRQQQLNRTPEQKEKYSIAHSPKISCIFCKKLFRQDILADGTVITVNQNSSNVFKNP